MLWQCYVDDHLMCNVEGNHLTSAAILSQDGTVLAQSLNFPQLKPEEIEGINKGFEEDGHLAQTGLFLGGSEYMVVQGEAGALIRGRKVNFLNTTELEKTILVELLMKEVSPTSKV